MDWTLVEIELDDCEEVDTDVKIAQFQNCIETKTKNNLTIKPPKKS